jgi:hypothetical protein
MGRPLNKKYFGNRNIGTNGNQVDGNLSNSQNYADDRIGGEGVASVTPNAEGSYTTALPTATFSTPDIPGGVRATGVVHGHALSAATTGNGTGYRVGDVLTVSGGTRTSAATFPVSAITTLGTPGITNGGSLYDVTSITVGDLVTFTHANFPTTPLIVRIKAVSGSTATEIAVEQQGIWTGTGAFPTSMANGVNGFTAATTARPGGDDNGHGLELSFTGSNWGVYSFGTVAVQGDYTAMPSNPVSFTGGTGSSAAATITFGVSGIEITQKGSGYSSVADAAITFSGGAASYTPVLTVDTGAVGSATNQENAILMTAYLTGGSATTVDVIRQVSGRRYKVTDGTRTGIVKLKDSAVNAAGEASITATDTAGNQYYITKLSNHRARVTRGTGASHQFASDSSVAWTANGTSGTKVYDNQPYFAADVNIKISNA